MRRLGVALAVVCAAVLVAASPANAQDRDCSDFGTQREAQLFFLRHGGPESDPHRLDDAYGDGNGIACESLPCPCYHGRSLPNGDESPPPRRFQTIRSKIIRVIDGDTIVIKPLERTKRSRYRVRLIGIDSPEKRPKECGSNLATENARRLAPRGRRVLLKTDPTQPMFDASTVSWPTCDSRADGNSTGHNSRRFGRRCWWSDAASSNTASTSGMRERPSAKALELGASAAGCTFAASLQRVRAEILGCHSSAVP